MPSQITPDPIGRYFPPGPYAIGFDTAAQDPLRGIADAANEFFFIFTAQVVRLHAMITVQKAVGPYLDYHGVFYGVSRLPNELDGPFRTRILAAVIGVTIPALITLSNAYYAAVAAPGTTPATVNVLDLQSNPAVAATIVVPNISGSGTHTGLLPGEFLVDVTAVIPALEAFFLDYSFLDFSFLAAPSSTIYTAATFPDPGLVHLINAKKAAAYRPVFRFNEVING